MLSVAWTRRIANPRAPRQTPKLFQPSHVLVAEMPDLLPDPFTSDGGRFIGHHLRFEPQSIFGLRLNGDAKIRSIREIRAAAKRSAPGPLPRMFLSLPSLIVTWVAFKRSTCKFPEATQECSGSPSAASSPCTPTGAEALRNRITIAMVKFVFDRRVLSRHQGCDVRVG